MIQDEKVLVTGGTGFLGAHVLVRLLSLGYKVKTTIRSLSRKNDVIEMIKNAEVNSLEHLEFIEADLTWDKNWDIATKNCTYVLHVASPFPSVEPANEDDLINPAKEGTLRVLKAAKTAGVKRVVMTSSFAAIGYSRNPENHIFTENDWTDPTSDVSAYVKSKTMAELAAWDFIRNEGHPMELTVINPVGIFGPVLGKDFSSSIRLIEQLLNGKMPAMPKLHFSMVDVRDVADLHIQAMVNPKAASQRYLAASGNPISLPDIAEILRNQSAENMKKIPNKVLPDWLVKLLAYVKPDLKPITTQLGKVKFLSTEKAENELGWEPKTQRQTILDTAKSLAKFKII